MSQDFIVGDQIESPSERISIQASESLKSILLNTPIAFYTCDAEGHINFFNKAAEDLWGRTPVIGKELWCGSWKILYPDNTPMPLEICPMALTLQLGERFEGVEVKIQRPDLSYRTARVYPKPIFDEKNQVVGAHNTLIDISAERKVESTQALLANIIKYSDDAIMSKDLTGIITSCNEAATTMFGYLPEEIIGKSIKTLIPKNRHKEEDKILEQISRGEQVRHYETERIRKDGRLIAVSLTVSPIKNKNGVIIGASKIARDVSELVSARKKLKQYTKELESLNTYKDEFMSIASHELKTPLTSAKAYIQLLAKTVEHSHKGFELTQRSVHSITRLENLIDNLLDISKIQAGKLHCKMETVVFNDVLKNCQESIQPLSTKHRLFINNETDVSLTGDKLRLEQVINNLLSNAIKYSPNADRVDLTVKCELNNLIVSVQDYGIGVPHDKIEHLIERYYRVETTYMRFPGLGIGLHITTEILKQHHGKLLIESKEGEGSTFTFIIPIK